jgi:hypothetical protein
MRIYIFFVIEIEYLNGRYDTFEATGNDTLKGFRSKAFPASLTGVLLEQFFKGVKCYKDLKEHRDGETEGSFKEGER